MGYYPFQGKYYTKTPGNLVDEEGNPVPATSNPCWAYKKDGGKLWTFGLPPKSMRLSAKYLALNYSEKSLIDPATEFGPYECGIATVVYQERTP